MYNLEFESIDYLVLNMRTRKKHSNDKEVMIENFVLCEMINLSDTPYNSV